MAQLHKKFTDKQIEQFIKRYLNKEIERKYIEKILDIKTRQFWKLVKKYKDDPEILQSNTHVKSSPAV